MTCILLFDSVHQVMRAEKLLKKQNLKIDLIPVPREISSDCGVAIELPSEIKEEALHLIEGGGLSNVICYRRNEGGSFEKDG
jgi:Protein of unknown function (DUF3343)